jgi:RNA polymerase-binding transcription factor DksA
MWARATETARTARKPQTGRFDDVILNGRHALTQRLHEARDGVTDLQGELRAIEESTVLVPDDEHDAEGSTIGFERARVSGLLAGAQERVADLEQALARFAAGSYFSCERCGGDIGVERLDALPSTRRCFDCARQA